MGIQGLVLFVEPDDMVGTGENYPFDAMPACRFVDMENAADIRAEDLFERTLHRDTAKVQDGVYPFNQLVDGLFVGKVAGEHFFVAVDRR